MKKFRFRLEKVLNLRLKEEEQMRAAFKSAVAQVIRVEQELAGLDAGREEAETLLLRERSRPAMQVLRILLLEEGLVRLALERRKAEMRLEAARTAAERMRLRLQRARRNREQLERIRTRHRKRYEAGMLAEERKTLDEVAVGRYLQQRFEGSRQPY